VRPCSRKGVLRAQLAEERMRAHERGDLRVALVRASDFYGVGVTNALLGDHFFQRVLRGKSAQVFGNPDLPHSYSYGPDVAETLIRLGQDERTWGNVWHVPTAPAESTRTLVDRFAAALGQPIKIAVIPPLLLRFVGLFNGVMRESVEMLYQFEIPFEIEDRKTRETFGLAHTPPEIAVPATAAWAKAHYAPLLRPTR
jgi:nucleoside-diphosphate-sugar epimerase